MSKNHNYTDYTNPKSITAEKPEDKVVTSDVAEEEVTELPKSQTIASAPPKTYVLKGCDLLNLRKEPDGDIVTTIKKGERLTENGFSSNKDWIAVETESGETGFVKAEFVQRG